MPQNPPTRPNYAESFRCIGSACEDTCCQGWSVPIDQAAYEKYRQLPTSPLRILIDANIQPTPDTGKLALFAKIRMNGQNQCPLLSESRLCRIHAELGEGLLSHACATYPRIIHSIGGGEETSLTLSCPEAARLVLLNPALLNPVLLNPALPAEQLFPPPAPYTSASAEDAPVGSSPLLPWFWAVRKPVLALVANRAYPLWQRLFLLGILCRRLDSIAAGELKRGVPGFLPDFEATVASGALRTAMESLPLDRAAQLDVVLRLAGMLLRRSNVRPRFVECVNAFTAGIGNGPGATLDSLASHYAQAYDRYFARFFDRHPHIMENYLANTILRCRFPFGSQASPAGPPSSMTREFALLTAQFALTKGLLIGVAGFHREAFSANHVVHTVQAASKHFEHHPEFLNLAYELLVESQMDGARGLAILLRNDSPAPPRPPTPEIHAPPPHVGARL